MNVSVIIPSYNDATYIDRLLEALVRQTDADFEVIVSDAQSNDGTEEVVKRFADTLDITLLQSPPKGPSNGRNLGAAKAKGDWLLFLDADDDFDDPHFIKTLVERATVKGWQTATAKIRIRKAYIHEYVGAAANYYYIKLLAHTKHPVAPGWCILTRRDLFEELGGFNEKIFFGEDYDYVTRAGYAGFGFVTQTSYFADMRRSREEGLSYAIKGIKNEIYRHTHDYNLERNPNKYEFGNHEKRQD